ncbi:class I SAM-dependent methyltransferase [Verrucomicrobiaceae bacterium 227]
MRLDHRESGLIKGAMKREVRPELLDSLPGDDPEALRSRRDLRLINFLMGNERWILRHLDGASMVELGAGGGDLTRQLGELGPVTGLDFLEKPEGLDCEWRAGDLFETFAETEGEAVVANLVLHHFEDEQLARLGELVRTRRRLVAVEPWRSRASLGEGAMLWPFINRVTKHDMMVSIWAGFQKGELPELLKLGSEWEWQEEVSLLGGLRVVAWRR